MIRGKERYQQKMLTSGSPELQLECLQTLVFAFLGTRQVVIEHPGNP